MVRRAVLTLLTYLLALVGVVGPTLLAVILLAGPHAGLLPEVGETIVLIVGWLLVILLPLRLALGTWRRTGRSGVRTSFSTDPPRRPP